MKICSIDDCNRKHCAKGYCKPHYRRSIKGSSLLKPIKTSIPNKGLVCNVIDCNNTSIKVGMCNLHWKRQWRQKGIGISLEPEYNIWNGMRTRCNNPKSRSYKDYGARGIEVCDRWNKYVNFIEDMGKRPSKEYSLERKDNSLGYQPDNCVWALKETQANNTRKNRLITMNGKTQSLALWAKELDVSYGMVSQRISRGMNEIDALMTKRST